MGVDVGVDTLNHALKRCAGTHLDEFLSAVAEHILYCGGTAASLRHCSYDHSTLLQTSV